MKIGAAADLKQHLGKFRIFAYENKHQRRASRVSPNDIVQEEQPVQQTFDLPSNSFQYSDIFDPNIGYYFFDDNLRPDFLSLSNNSCSGLANFAPAPETNISTNILNTPLEAILNVNSTQPATDTYINQDISNESAFFEGDLAKRMELLNVAEVIDNKPNISNPDATPKTSPSRPNPPHLRGSGGPRYVRASELFTQYFDELDKNHDGKISFAELQECLKNRDVSNYTNFSDETIRMLIEAFDDDSDEAIDIKEFPKLAAFLGNWGRCFTFLDSDKSGNIDYEEMHGAMEALGFNLNSTFMKELIQRYNRNGNTCIDFDNFILACVTLCRFKESFDFMMKNCGSASSHISLESFLRQTVLLPNRGQNM